MKIETSEPIHVTFSTGQTKDLDFKYGFHFIFPTLDVDLETHDRVHADVVKGFEERCTSDESLRTLLHTVLHTEHLTEAFDAQPLRNGMRLLGTHKIQACRRCQKVDQAKPGQKARAKAKVHTRTYTHAHAHNTHMSIRI